MASASIRWLVRRALVGLVVGAALIAAAGVALVLYARGRVADAEERCLGTLEALVVEPAPSSPESLAFGERFLAAAARLPDSRPAASQSSDGTAPRVPDELVPLLDVFLAAADVPPAHELLELGDEQGLQLLRAARLLDGAAQEAAARGDAARQVRCAEALAAIAGALGRRTSLVGLLLGTAVEQIELSTLQRLVEDPASPPEVLARAAGLLERSPVPLHASFAGEALELARFDLPPEHPGWTVPLVAPLQEAVVGLLRARTLERLHEFAGELDRPLTEMLDGQQPPPADVGPLDAVAWVVLPNTRDAFVKAKSLEVVRELGREAVAARQSGRTVELARPEVAAALERYWELEQGDQPLPFQQRTLALLSWKVGG